MKRGQLNQVFIYILAILVIAFIFFFGYQQINNLLKLAEKTKFIEFQRDLEKAINNIYYKNPGSTIYYSKDSRNKPLILPKDASKICFKKFTNKAAVSSDSAFSKSFDVENLIPESGTNLKLEDGKYCQILKNSEFKFILENKIQNQETIVIIK
jgi:hypothetical protein